MTDNMRDMMMRTHLRTIQAAAAMIVMVCAFNTAWADAIRVGASLSSRGKYAEPSQMIRIGYEMWVERINAEGGLLGRPVRLILYDDGSALDRVRQHYTTLLEKDRVDLLLSPYGSPATMVASELSEAHGKVMIACAAASEKVYSRGFRYLFGLYAPADRYCIGFLDLLARSGMSRTAIIYEDSTFHRSIKSGFYRWADIFGVDAVYTHAFPVNAPEFGKVIDDLKLLDPDALIFSAYPPEGYAFIAAMENKGYWPSNLFMPILPVHPDFHQKAGALAEGVFAPSNWEPIESIPFPGTKQFIADFKEKAGYLPSYHATAAYASCQLLQRAVEATGAIDHDKMREYIFRLDTVSIMGRFKVNENGQQVGHNPILIQWQNGRKEIVYPAKMKTASPFLNR